MHLATDAQGAEGGLIAADIFDGFGFPQHDMKILPVPELGDALVRCGQQGDMGDLCRAWQYVEWTGMEFVVELVPEGVQIKLVERGLHNPFL